MVKEIRAAARYTKPDDLWVISCYFNPCCYKSKEKNYQKFIEAIEASGLHYIVIECVFRNQAFFLPEAKNIFRVRAEDVIWQKERLLNIVVGKLPRSCRKVAWVDCDILFENADWAKEASQKLRYYKVLQPFKEAIRLPKNCFTYFGKGLRYYSFGYMVQKNPLTTSPGIFNLHGHTGFAWASHRSWIEKYGLYDASVGGSGDHMMAHTFVGDWESECMKKMFGSNEVFYRHYEQWSNRVYPVVRSKISYVEGAILHLWHGDEGNRNYSDRHRAVENFGYDPVTDITLDGNQCWKWSHRNTKFKKWAKEYFVLRKEDK